MRHPKKEKTFTKPPSPIAFGEGEKKFDVEKGSLQVGRFKMSCGIELTKVRKKPLLQENVFGSMPEWLMGADCKSAGNAYAGSNPARPNTKIISPL